MHFRDFYFEILEVECLQWVSVAAECVFVMTGEDLTFLWLGKICEPSVLQH